MTFASDLSRFSVKTLNNISEVYRASLFDIFTAILLGTPVDKGILRNSWFIGIDVPYFEDGGRIGDGRGALALAELQERIGDADIFSTVFYTNPMPYGPRIEFDGYSGKAPEGMVRVNVLRWQAIVDRNARLINK